MTLLETTEPRFVRDGIILAAFKLGLDTCAIAQRLNLTESHVANRLARLRNAVPE